MERSYDLKKIVIFGIIIVAIAVGIGYFALRKNPSTIVNEPASTKPIFPFGSEPTQPGTTETPTDGPAAVIPTNGDALSIANTQPLRQITNYPITDFIALRSSKTVREPKLDPKTGQTVFVSSAVSVPVARFNIRASGFLVDAELSNDAIQVSQKTQTRVPAAGELWMTAAGTAIYRSWNHDSETIDTLIGTLPPAMAPATFCKTTLTLTLSQGSKGVEVAELQKYLNQKLTINLATDGSFGKKTTDALKQAQKSLGLADTGMTDTATRAALATDCAKLLAEYQAKSKEPATLALKLLTGSIIRGDVSPDGNSLFFLKTTGQTTTGFISAANGTKQRKLFESPLSEWRPDWFSPTGIGMTTLASREADGYLYFLDTTTGTFKKILGPLRGLTTLVSPDGKKIIYSQSTDTGFTAAIYTPSTGATQTIGLATLPEKCGWQSTTTIICGVPKSVPAAPYPDAWYQGQVSFTDTLWSIDTTSGATRQIASWDQPIDATRLRFDPNGEYVYFMNHTDNTLWSYRLR